MKMMSKRDCEYLSDVKNSLEYCIGKMKGKYGTHTAVSNLEASLILINQCIKDDEYYKRVYQQFRNPPDTPKSRRLGWHEKGEAK